MYLESIKSNRNGKTYVTHLVRETFREDGKIKHRTISNVSKLPAAHLQALKKSLKGIKGDFDMANLRHGRSYEFGASHVFMELAKDLDLDKIIFSKKTQWRPSHDRRPLGLPGKQAKPDQYVQRHRPVEFGRSRARRAPECREALL